MKLKFDFDSNSENSSKESVVLMASMFRLEFGRPLLILSTFHTTLSQYRLLLGLKPVIVTGHDVLGPLLLNGIKVRDSKMVKDFILDEVFGSN